MSSPTTPLVSDWNGPNGVLSAILDSDEPEISSNSMNQNIQLIIPYNNYGYGINSDGELYDSGNEDAALYAEDSDDSDDDIPYLDVAVPHLDSWDELWGSTAVTLWKCNASIP